MAMKRYADRVGHAYRGKDGLVRWITWMSKNNNYSMSWLDEKTGIWHDGGHAKASKWVGSMYDGPEVPAPQPGEKYHRLNVFGNMLEATA